MASGLILSLQSLNDTINGWVPALGQAAGIGDGCIFVCFVYSLVEAVQQGNEGGSARPRCLWMQ